jgi:hypothetical protein
MLSNWDTLQYMFLMHSFSDFCYDFIDFNQIWMCYLLFVTYAKRFCVCLIMTMMWLSVTHQRSVLNKEICSRTSIVFTTSMVKSSYLYFNLSRSCVKSKNYCCWVEMPKLGGRRLLFSLIQKTSQLHIVQYWIWRTSTQRFALINEAFVFKKGKVLNSKTIRKSNFKAGGGT